MHLFKSRKLHLFVQIICVACIIAMMTVSFTVYHASIPNFIAFLLFMVIFVQLPGNAILYFLKINTKHLSERVLLGLFTGWGLIVLEYFVCNLAKIDIFYYINPILIAVYFYFKSKERTANSLKGNAFGRILSIFSNIPSSFYICVVITLLYVILLTQYRYLSPGTGSAVFASSDKAFQMGIINSLVQDFPATNPWVDGMTIHYHVFSQILYAAAISIFPCLTSDFIVMSCGPYLLVFSLCISFYALYKRFCKNEKRAGMYTLLVILSYPFIARSPIKSYIFRILLVNDNYAGYGIAAAIAWIILLDIYYNDSKERKLPIIFLLIAEIMLLTGIKAPMAVVLLGAFFGTLILAAIMKKAKLSDFGLVAISGICFALIYKLLLVSSSSGSGSSSSVFAFAKINNLCFWKKPLIDFLANLHISGNVRLSIVMLVFFIGFFSIFFFPMCVGYIREFVLVISRKKDFDIPRITIYAATLVGTLLMIILSFSGHSQIYFGLVGFAFSSIIAFWFFEDVTNDSAKWMQVLRKICVCLLFICLIVSTSTLGIQLYKNINASVKFANPSKSFSRYRSINLDELDAMKWLKENTPDDSLIATQMYSSVSPKYYSIDNRYQNCHFLYAVFSCRNYYLEGSGFSIDSSNVSLRKKMLAINDKLFDSSNENRGDLADKLGVDYVVVTKFVEGPIKLDNEDYEKCYTNDTIDIYEIK